ncbi:CAZyme family GH20 [Penicillium capsulatum]|uniref:beta-N-acetylhexosaminidase n=1 Tax=Penicillium capsulatum TaxID=69766 RepID=A0A9W9LVJ2_9EURO|nr:CAZyme family GH20 [Penicillium capsulatum]KAJ6123104.1 CAZyme family GH20 [Penicillium capsulatum]
MMAPLILYLAAVVGASALQTLPPVQSQSHPDQNNGFSFDAVDKVIYLTDDFASWRDQDGLTLIPPSASEFAHTFQKDLHELTNTSWELRTVKEFPKHVSGIFLDRASDGKFTYEDGAPTEEGYELVIEADRVLIHASGSRGMWWGTRTLLQQLILNTQSSLPLNHVKDSPAYATRGFMLDAGRKWYSLDFLKDLCTYASFFKLSEFHYHATDNFPLSRGPNVRWNEVYSQFALRPENPDLRPLVQRENETLSRADFDDFQSHCAQRGVTVIPEIEAPGHCLTVTKWKPELALDQQDLLNLSHPDTIPLVKSIWSEFLPWFRTKEVHIGADEYDATLANDYIGFVNEMRRFIQEKSGKRIRIWGTDEPSDTASIDKDITIQHWQYGQSDPVTLARDGYQLINSEDWWAYMSLKNKHIPIAPAPYPQFFNNDRVLNFADQKGWQWAPHLFNPVNKTEQPDPKAVKGAILAAWNDNGHEATTQLEAYYAIRNGIPVVASRAWSGTRGPLLDEATLDESIERLTANAVGQNLDRKVSLPLSGSLQHRLGHGSKGMNYTLQLNVTGPFSLHSEDVTLSLADDGRLSCLADGETYPLRAVAETDGFDPEEPGRIWANTTTSTHKILKVPVPAEITITTNAELGSRVWVNGKFVGRFEVFVYGGKNSVFSWSQMALVAPLEFVRGSGLQNLAIYG